MLSPAPMQLLDQGGRPRFGTYLGELFEVDLLSQPAGPGGPPGTLQRLKRKRWHYTLVTTPELLLAMAVVDVGYAANAFLCAVDRATRERLADESFLGLPGLGAQVGNRPGAGLKARFMSPGATLYAGRPGARYVLEADISGLRRRFQGGLRLRAEVASAPRSALTVVAPTPEGGVNVTQKSQALTTKGELTVGGKRYSLDGGVAAMDYTQGILPRHTEWAWASGAGRLADGTALGFNLVQGFNDASPEANENALWLGAEVLPLGRARFTFRRDEPLDPWTVTTSDGAVDLRFKPLYAHREHKDLVWVKSRFVQVLGAFHGTVRAGDRVIPIDGLPGAVEDQDMLW